MLVVDDDPAAVELLWEFLTAKGYEVLSAGNGAEALRTVKEERPHLVLLDIRMPRMDGLALAVDQLRRLGAGTMPVTPSSLKMLARRLKAIADHIRLNAWTDADALFQHKTAPPHATPERPVHIPFLGRSAAESDAPRTATSPVSHPRIPPGGSDGPTQRRSRSR